MSNVFGYVRVSSKGQINGDGFPRQEAAIQAFCLAHGLTLVASFEEKGVSGDRDAIDRPAFTEMMTRSLEVGAIVVERLDRLARELLVSEALMAACRKRSISVYSADHGTLVDLASDAGDPARVMMRQIFGAVAQFEKNALVKKLRAARDRVRAEQGWCEGPKVYGTNSKAEQAIMVTVFSLRARGMSIRGIARYMTDSGIVNNRAKSGGWSRGVIEQFLVRHKERVKEYQYQVEPLL